MNTHDDLWAGVDLKLAHATFHLNQMWRSIERPASTPHSVALESAGATTGGPWHQAFYAHFDAFLSATRSVADVIQCCFGEDARAPREMRDWFQRLDPSERDRRRRFSRQFRGRYKTFSNHTLSAARNVSVHRTGAPKVIARVTGTLGVTYEGGPLDPLPTSELPKIDDPALGHLARARRVDPTWKDFTIEGRPLDDACSEYLASATALATEARKIATKVHGDNILTEPLTPPALWHQTTFARRLRHTIRVMCVRLIS